MSAPFTSFPIPTILVTDWGLPVSVKDFGAVGDGVNDDTAAIQNATDAAFGPAGSPNGANYQLNKPLFFPNGIYKITTPIQLTQVQGAIIEGAGKFATTIFNTNGTGCFQSNGLSYCTIRNMHLSGSTAAIGFGQLHNLSNGNLTVSRRYLPTTLHEQLSHSVAFNSTGKFYCEMGLDFQYGGIGNVILGIGNAAAQSGSGTNSYIGGDTNSIGNAGGFVFFNNANITNVEYFTEGDTVGMAVDLGAKLIWWRSNAGLWNNNGAANPATGTGGISFASIAAGPYYVYVDSNFVAGGSQVTFNFGATGYVASAPAGFSNWGGGTPTTIDPNTTTQFSQFDMNWNGSGPVSLQSNTFQDIFFDGADIGCKMGGQGFQGSENLFINCFFNAHYQAGLQTQNFNALGNIVIGGNMQGCYYGVLVNAGSVPTIQTQFQKSVQWDVQVLTAADDTYQIGSRTESTWFCNFARGVPILSGCLQSNALATIIPGTTQVFTLSTDSLTLTSQDYGVTMGEQIIRSTNNLPGSTKTYFELKIVSTANASSVELGIGKTTVQRGSSTNAFLGIDNTGIGYYGQGSVYRNNFVVTTIQTFASGDTVCVAVDTSAQLIWFRTNGGNWNNNAANNPATGVGGIDISAIIGLRPSQNFVYVDLPSAAYNTVITANFGGSSYAFTPPAGYGNLSGTWANTYLRAPTMVNTAAPATVIGSLSKLGQLVGNGTIDNCQIGRNDWTTGASYWTVNHLRVGTTIDGSGIGTPVVYDIGRFYNGTFIQIPGDNFTQTVASLPPANASKGERVTVSDSTVAAATNFGAVVSGGGANVVPVYSDGTNWRIG